MDEERIEDKIIQIEEYLNSLISYTPNSFEEYAADLKTKAACERVFEKIVESVVDLAFLFIKEKKLKIPEEDKEAFEIISKANIISNQLNLRLQDAKSMRNFIAHRYGEIDDEKVFHAVTEELIPDVREFLNDLNKNL